MGLFDRFKKQDKAPEPKPSAPSAPGAGLIDFHPYDTGLAESVRALEADLRKLNTNGRRPCGRDEFIALLGDEAEGIFLMTGFVPGNTEPAYVEANDAYKAMYSGEEIDQYGMGAYDTIAMFADACAEAGGDRAAIKDWLYGMVNWEGSSGLYTMTETGDPLKPCYPMIIKDGKFIQYEE